MRGFARGLNYSSQVTSRAAADLTMVVPTYNEKDRLAELVSRLFDAASAAGLALELVVVDDNSPDGTGQLADELATKHRVTVIHRAGKLGLGTAVVEPVRKLHEACRPSPHDQLEADLEAARLDADVPGNLPANQEEAGGCVANRR